jgi:succinate dehydrogenase / fumarate reductase iron-sulfur subunit
MEVDPGFIGPAALAKAYRFVGDPRDDQQFERLNDLAQDPEGIFDCTHCFKCVEACPKDVNPMGQIMRLRRIATNDHHIVDVNNGERHEAAFTGLIKDNGLLWEAELLPRSYGGNSWFGKFAPPAGKELLSSLPAIIKALIRGKVTPMGALKPHKLPKDDLKAVQAIYDKVEGREQRFELNLYIAGEDEDAVVGGSDGQSASSAPGPEGATSSAPLSDGQGADASAPTGETPSASTPQADPAGSENPEAAGGEEHEPREDDPTGEGPGEGADSSSSDTEGSAQ